MSYRIIIIIALWTVVWLNVGCDAGPVDMSLMNENCTDYMQQQVVSGERFVPAGYDACTTCVCTNGIPQMCLALLCQFPCSNYVPVEDKCCEFICSNATFFETDGDNLITTNIGLRLVASIVTSFLILALLLFMIHRLRQRRLLLMLRRLNAGRLTGNYGARRFSYDEDGSVSYLTGNDQVDFGLYEDPPPPYTFWKPPESYFPQEEAPPPYEPVNTFSSNNALNRQQVLQSLPSNLMTTMHNESHLIYPIQYSAPLSTFANPRNEVANLRTCAFPLNDLDQESSDRRPRHSVPIQELNVVGSLSSLTSSQSDLNESQSVTRTSDSTDAVIRSDATYEDLVPAAGRTGLLIPPITMDEVQMRNEHSSNALYDQRPLKCHSCSDVVVDNWLSRAEKRRSLQAGVMACPDPTKWNVDGSESSSSSSPTFDRLSLSPTSSDSSSIGAYPFETEVSNLNGVIKKDATHHGASSNSSLLFSNNRRAMSGESSDSGKKVQKGTSKLRQILGSFNSNHTVPKKASMRDKKGLGHKNRHSVATNIQADGENRTSPVSGADGSANYRTFRILYVNDGDNSHKSLNVAPEKNNSEQTGMCETKRVRKTVKCRPHSYDFGDLNAGGTFVRNDNASDCRNPSKQDNTKAESEVDAINPPLSDHLVSSSLDSFTCTCSSRASFGSEMLLQSSSTFHSQEGLALSPDLHRCSSVVAEPPSSPDNGEDGNDTDTEGKWRQAQSSTSSQNNSGHGHSCRSANNEGKKEENDDNVASTSQQFSIRNINENWNLVPESSKSQFYPKMYSCT